MLYGSHRWKMGDGISISLGSSSTEVAFSSQRTRQNELLKCGVGHLFCPTFLALGILER